MAPCPAYSITYNQAERRNALQGKQVNRENAARISRIDTTEAMTQFGWASCPHQLKEHVETFVRQAHTLLADDLTGIYLHGSLAMSCFNPTRSDVNLLVITRQPPHDEAMVALARLLLAHSGNPYPYEMTLMQEPELFPWRYPTPYTFAFDESGREALQNQSDHNLGWEPINTPGESHRLALAIKTLHTHGICLYGRPVPYTFPQFPHDHYVDALARDTRHARETMMQDPPRTILNLTRNYYYLLEGRVTSKDSAGEWALSTLPETVQSVVTDCLAYYRGEKTALPFDPIDLAHATAYLDAKISEQLLRREGR